MHGASTITKKNTRGPNTKNGTRRREKRINTQAVLRVGARNKNILLYNMEYLSIYQQIRTTTTNKTHMHTHNAKTEIERSRGRSRKKKIK